MNKVLVPLAILLGAAIGAVTYFVASQCGRATSAPSAAEATLKADLASLRTEVTGLRRRLDELAARPTITDALNDPAMRAQVAAIVAQESGRAGVTPDGPPGGREAWRTRLADHYRKGYDGILEEMRKALNLDQAGWHAVEPLLRRHFQPVEVELSRVIEGKVNVPPDVHSLVAPRMAASLGEIRSALGSERAGRFDAWRKAPEKAGGYGAGKGEYFLDGEAYLDYRVDRAVSAHWPVLNRELQKFLAQRKLPSPVASKFNAVMNDHLKNLFAAHREEARLTLSGSKSLSKTRQVAAATDKHLAEVLGLDGLRRFRAWRRQPGCRAAIYFGERSASEKPSVPQR